MPFTKAVKFDAKLRMSIAGPSGAGKTYTALTLATALADGGSIAVIDTERGSASKYADLFSFDVMELEAFHPEKFIEGIRDAAQAGYAVLVIDSLSHAWNGTGGLLDIVDAIAKRKYNSNTFAAWKDATPLQNALIDAITASPLHILVTMRSKQEYAQEKNERTGKMEIKKLGMAPIQRDGMEYEFDIAVDMDIDNTMIVQKSRCSALSGQIISKPDSKVADILKNWLSGVPAPVQPVLEAGEVATRVGKAFGFKPEDFEKRWQACKQHVLNAAVPDEQLTQAHLKKLLDYAIAHEQKTAQVAQQAS